MNKFVFWVVIVVMIGGLYYLYSSFNDTGTPAVGPQQKTFDLVVQNRRLVSGPSTLNVKQGDTVTINITADENEELHLHGHDFHVAVIKGSRNSLTFQASAGGRFPYELEHSKTELGALEVQQ